MTIPLATDWSCETQAALTAVLDKAIRPVKIQPHEEWRRIDRGQPCNLFLQEFGLAGQDPIVPFDKFDINKVVVDKAGVEDAIPQRFEMSQMDGLLYIDKGSLTAVGFKDVTENEFWIRGHMPEFALMPGVLMCEAAAQVIAYITSVFDVKEHGIVGFGGLNNVKFRGMVVPGDKLILMAHVRKVRKNVMVICDFQGYVDGKLVVDGEIKGVVLPPDALKKQ